MTSDPTDSVTSTYDPENRIATAAKNGVSTTYTYDDDGNRVEKSSGGGGTLYWYMSPGIVAESDLLGNLQSEYVFFDGERVARKDFPGLAVSYYFSDHLKTASVITDAAGNIKSESDYYPWGGELQFLANDSNHYKFTAKERDIETGLDYFGARYYSGRFISSDWSAAPIPVPYADFGDPQSLNLYGYVRNIPTSSVDLDGHGCPPACSLQTPSASEWKVILSSGPLWARVVMAAPAAGPIAALATPSVGGMAIVIAGPKLQQPEGDGCLCPDNTAYVWTSSANQSTQTQTQQGQQDKTQTQSEGQTEEQKTETEPKTSTSGGQKGAGGSGKSGKGTKDRAKDYSQQGTVDQLKSIQKDQKMKNIESTKKSEQNVDNANKKIKSSEDIEHDH